MATITIYQKNTATIEVTVTQDGEAFDLTGYTCTFNVKKNKTDETFILEKEGSVSSNVITFDLTADDTDIDNGSYVYEVLISKETPEFRRTVCQDVLVIKDSINN